MTLAERAGTRLDEDRLDAAFSLVARQVTQGRTSYAGLAVADASGLIRSAAWDAGGAAEPVPRTAIASITKPMTATAIMQLVERGLLSLVEPVATYLPGFAPRPPDGSPWHTEAVNAWHILTHTSGIPDADDDFYLTAPPTPEAQVGRIADATLRFAPGTANAYASDSFYILAALVTELSGEPYPAYLRRHVFEPLGMDDTSFDPYGTARPPRPLEGSFGPPDVPFEDKAAYFAAMSMPGGGLWSTPEDVARFGRAMLLAGTVDGVRILGRPFVRLMTRRHAAHVPQLDTGGPHGTALGWGLPGIGRGSPASEHAFGHSGATGSLLVIDPEHELVVVYLRNEWGNGTALADEAVQAVYGAITS